MRKEKKITYFLANEIEKLQRLRSYRQFERLKSKANCFLVKK